jgi:hypothetical protein
VRGQGSVVGFAHCATQLLAQVWIITHGGEAIESERG